MNPLAQNALARARAKVNGDAGSQLAAEGRVRQAPPTATPVAQALVFNPVPGQPIDRVLFLEGQRFAVDLVASMKAMIGRLETLRVMADTLRRACPGKPISYQVGVSAVLGPIQAEIARQESLNRKNVARS